MLNLFKKISLLGLLIAALVAPAAMAASDSPVLDRVLDFKVLKVGMSGNQAPMNTNSRSGQIIGYDVDLARALAGAMGARLEIVTMPFGELLGRFGRRQNRHGHVGYVDYRRTHPQLHVCMGHGW